MLLGVLRRKLISDIRARAIKNYEDWVREVRLVVPEYAIDDIILPLEQLECETCLGAADGSCLYAFDSYNTKGGWCLAEK